MDNESTATIKLAIDIEEENNPTKKFKELSNIIKRAIITNRPPYTIGLYGKWGTGKTTLMKLIEKDLSEHKDEKSKILTVEFNAWRYERENERATVPLILTILKKLNDRIKDDTRRKWFDKNREDLMRFVKGWSVNLSFPILFGNMEFTYDQVNDEHYNKFTKPSIQSGIELIKKLYKQINKDPNNTNLKIVVFIDDLDRCSPTKTIEVFESIKILLGIDEIIYVLGLNYDVINKRINEENIKNNIQDENYLEKIIQIPVWIPPWEKEDFSTLLDQNIEIDKKYKEIFEDNAELLFNALQENPRALKRTINSFIITVEKFKNDEEIEFKKLLIVDLLNLMWHDVYQKFSTDSEFRKKIKELPENDNERRKKLNEFRKNRSEYVKLSSDDEILVNLYDDFWKFYMKVKKELNSIANWSLYRKATESVENEKKSIVNEFYTLLQEGNDFCYNRNYLNGIKSYNQAIKINPDNSDAYNNKGIALTELGRYEEAITSYDTAIKINPNNATVYSNKSNTLSKLGRHEEAITACDTAIKINPVNSDAYNNKGIVLRKLGRHEEAITAYDTAIKINPDNSDVYANKGNTLSELGRHEEAITAYDTAIKINPDNSDAYNNKGIALSELGRHEEAITSYDTAIKINPDNSDVYSNKGNTLSKLGRHEESITACDTAIKINPDNSNAYNIKGIALSKLGRHEEAITSYDTAIKINPDNAAAYSNKGNTLTELGRHEEAMACFDKVEELNNHKFV